MNEAKELIFIKESIFEKVKKSKESGAQYWFARDFQVILEYKEWRKFLGVIEKAKEACVNSGQKISGQQNQDEPGENAASLIDVSDH